VEACVGKSSDKGKILITGASGFVGSRAGHVVKNKGFSVRCASRQSCGEGAVQIGNLGPQTDWSKALEGIQTLVHLAARVHVMADAAEDPPAEFRRVNVKGTRNLARQAAEAGVKRLVFLSSVKVNGERTDPGRPFTIQDVPAPQGTYAISKFEAEQSLRRVEAETGLEVVIIRPPLVYGPGVKANFLRLMQAVQKGLPLPLGEVQNKRSMVGLDNLVDLIVTCIDHPSAAGETFLTSDGEDVSTPELIRRIARALDKPARLFPAPEWLLKCVGTLTGKSVQMEQLCGSLQIDSTRTANVLGWAPPCSMEEELDRIAEWFKQR
jgi:nucleoside-diphosphate-sugar epimerase